MPPKGQIKLPQNPPKPTADEAINNLLSALRSEFTAEAERIAKVEAKSCLALLQKLEDAVSEAQRSKTTANKMKTSPTVNMKKTVSPVVQTAKKAKKGNAAKQGRKNISGVTKGSSESGSGSEVERPKKKLKTSPLAAKPKKVAKAKVLSVPKPHGRLLARPMETQKVKAGKGREVAQSGPSVVTMAKCAVCKESNLRNNRLVKCHGSCMQVYHARKICGNIKIGQDDTWVCKSCTDENGHEEMADEADDENEDDNNEDGSVSEDGEHEQGSESLHDDVDGDKESDGDMKGAESATREKPPADITRKECSPNKDAFKEKDGGKEFKWIAYDSGLDAEYDSDTDMTDATSDYEFDSVHLKLDSAGHQGKADLEYRRAVLQEAFQLDPGSSIDMNCEKHQEDMQLR